MSKANRVVKRAGKALPSMVKYQSPFGPRPTLRKIQDKVFK